MLTIMGYRISERALRAGRDAIAEQTRSFPATPIGRAMAPHIRQSKDAWPGMTIKQAAEAAAEDLLWREAKAGRIEPTGTWLNRQYWRRVKAPPTERNHG